MVREHSSSVSSNGYPPPPNTNNKAQQQGPPIPQQHQHQHPPHPYYGYGGPGSAPGGPPPGYPEGPFAGPPPGNASAGGDSNKNNAVVGHHHHHHPPPPPPYASQVQGPPVPGRPPYGPPRNPPPHQPPVNGSNNINNKNNNSKKNPGPPSARPYPAPDGSGPPSATSNGNPPAPPIPWQSIHPHHGPPPDNGPNGPNPNNVNGPPGPRMPYGAWNADQAAGHHAAAHHHHAAAAAAAAAGYWPPPGGPHYGPGPPNGSPQRPPPPPHFWRPVPGPPPPHAPQSQHAPPQPHAPQSSQHPPSVARQDPSRPSRPGGPLPVPSSAGSPTGPSSAMMNNNNNTKNGKMMSKSAINKHNNMNNNPSMQLQQQQHHQQQSSPGGGGGSKINNSKQKIASLHGAAPGSVMAADMVARLGATSPTQIETTHRDEVQIMGCTCKKTRCLKLYCQCFGVKLHCGPACRCLQCFNTRKHEKQRKEAMRQILARNPGAFDTKFQKNAKAATSAAAVTNKILAHKLGCKCRKSACMKKYCECYAGSVKCSPSCRCVGCKNIGPFGGPNANGGASGADQHVAAGPIRRPVAKPARRKKSEPFQAAQNLTFLKHGSPDSVKSMVRKQPGGATAGGNPGESGVHEVASMPSLASSSEGTSPGEYARHNHNRSNYEDEDEHDRKQHGNMSNSHLNGLMGNRTKPVLDEQDDDVKTLLMAAYAMAEIGKGSSPAKRGCSPGTTESTTATAMTMMTKSVPVSQPSAQSSPASFRDVKRPRSDQEGSDSAAYDTFDNNMSLDAKRMHFE